MPPEVQPPELARVVDLAERPRSHGWSFRAALTRYAQPQPERASVVVELIRRTEWALGKQSKVIEREGPALWAALGGGGDGAGGEVDAALVDLLRAAAELDRLGEVMAAWAVERQGERPDGLVDEVVADVTARLEALGVPREERPPAGARRRGV